MKRADRMFGIVVDLQAHKTIRAEDLAAHYGTSLRTIYRDVAALCEAGIPIVSLPGQGYALPREFFFPPLSLTLEEAASLLLGVDYVQQTLDPAYRSAAALAGKKIEAIVPSALREPLDEVRRAVRLIATPGPSDELETLRLLRAAIAERRVMSARYRGERTADPAGTGEIPRRIAPYALAHLRGVWYVVGHSFERDAVRRFRLSRFEELRPTAEHFELPTDFVLGPPASGADLPLLIRIAFNESELGKMHERLRNFDATLEVDGPRIVATFRTHSESAIASSILGWGGGVRVLEPASVRERILTEARRIIAGVPDTPLSVR